MKSNRVVAALVASAGLLWGSAQAAPEAAQEQIPEIIILEMQPMEPGAVLDEQTLLGMLLLQLLSAMQAQGENVEIQFIAPQVGERI